MHWKDEGYLLSKNNFSENSIIIETFTYDHGKASGIVYGGASQKEKKKFQVGNKILLNWKSKNTISMGYFTTELIKPISPLFFDNKKKSICILSASTILKILLPERQINKKIYNSFEELLQSLSDSNWINFYIHWELFLIKELGFEINFLSKNSYKDKTVEINNKFFKIPKLLMKNNESKINNTSVKEALEFNKSILIENFILPNRLRMPLSRNILEKYFN